jgi:tetratricopeptide (TPR) repeat protein
MTATSRESAILQAVVAVVVGLAVNAAVLGGDSSKDGSDPALRSYHAANGLLNRGLFEPAIAEYRSFLSEHGDHEKAGVARYGLAVCLFRLERYDEGVSELAPLRKLDDFLFAAEAAVIEGQCHLARGRYAEAAAAFDDVLRRFGDHEMADDAATGAAEALYRGGKYEDAAARCRELASRRSESPVRERGEFFWAMSDMARNDFGGAADRRERSSDNGERGRRGESGAKGHRTRGSHDRVCEHRRGAGHLQGRGHSGTVSRHGVDRLGGCDLVSRRDPNPEKL